MHEEYDEYGIAANIVEIDRAFRRGAKAWMADFYRGVGERATWIALSRSGRMIEKVAPIHRFKNFRCKWIPEHLRDKIFQKGTKAEMQQQAAFLEQRAEDERNSHPNRMFQQP